MAKDSTRQPSEKQLAHRKKFAEAARARHEAKRQQLNTPPVVADQPEPDNQVIPQIPSDDLAKAIAEAPPRLPAAAPVQGETTVIATDDLNEMMKYIRQLESNNWRESQARQTPSSGVEFQNGKMVGSIEKYKLEGYPDPSERLYSEPRLARFAFRENYIIKFRVNISEWVNAENVRIKEPKFETDLLGIVFDEETGEPKVSFDPITGQEQIVTYIALRHIMHEDPDTALFVARQNGIDVSEVEEDQFLDEMRYLRIREWLFDHFYPKPIVSDSRAAGEMVVNGQRVEIMHVSSGSSAGIPFDKMNRDSKLRS